MPQARWAKPSERKVGRNDVSHRSIHRVNQAYLEQARQRHGDGDLDGAETIYRSVLGGRPDSADALYGLGLVALDRKKPDDAIAILKQAAAANPDDTDTLTALGIAFVQAGLPAKATTVLAETVKRAPEYLEPRLHLARAFAAVERDSDAHHVLKQTVLDFPDAAEAWVLKGRTERRMNTPDAAYESFKRAADLNPEDPKIFNDLGVTYRAMETYAEAKTHYLKALALDPELAVAHANLGNVLDLMDDFEAAEVSLRRAVDLDPETPDATYNLACVLTKLERPDDALPLFESLTAASPDRWDALTNLGVTRLALGDLSGAEGALRNSLSLKSNNPEAHYNLAWLLLLSDRHPEGWAELEWRWHLPEFIPLKQIYEMPAWDGSPMADGTLLLHAEQGLGDTLQFVRFVEQARARCARVVLACQEPLVRLLTGLGGIDEIVDAGDPSPSADAHAPLLSLPHILGFNGTDTPGAAGYVTASAPDDPRLQVPKTGRRRIGLVWAGSPDNKIERRRKMEAHAFLPLFDAVDADFVALQVGPAAGGVSAFPNDRVTFECADTVTDFADTAAVISQLDLVIGVDTSVIHLAGALGIPTWALLPFMPDYRWGLGRDNTPWYDSIRLFRQPGRGDWETVIAAIGAALRSW